MAELKGIAEHKRVGGKRSIRGDRGESRAKEGNRSISLYHTPSCSDQPLCIVYIQAISGCLGVFG